MDWNECLKKRIVKKVSHDKNLVFSLQKRALECIDSANRLPEENFCSKISLLYDALRIHLEILAIENGFKIYNHECYAAFLKEIMKESRDGDGFDRLRKIRNGINYYGKDIDWSEAEYVIKMLNHLIKRYGKK